MPASTPTTKNPIAGFFEDITYKDPVSDYDATDIAHAVEEHFGAVEHVRDANEAGWMVPRGEAIIVTTEKGEFMVTVRAVS